MDTMDAIRTRRSVRKFKPDPIPDDLLNKVLEAAQMAPSWANVQPWKFYVVKNSNMKEQLSGLLSKNNPAAKGTANAPVVIVACAIKGISGYYKGEQGTIHGDYSMYDLGIATQNICLAAWNFGLGTVHAAYLDMEKAAELLKLPDNMVVMEIIPMGYPDHTPSAPKRKEIQEISEIIP